VRRSYERTKWWFTVIAAGDSLDTLDDSWSVMENNMTWKLQKSLCPPGTPGESEDVTQSATAERIVSTPPAEETEASSTPVKISLQALVQVSYVAPLTLLLVWLSQFNLTQPSVKAL
jgi:hypothetical protein